MDKAQFKPLKQLISQVYGKALEARSNRTHCLTLARFAGKLEPIVREVELVTSLGAAAANGSADVAAAAIVAVTSEVVGRALDLVGRAGGMGKCRAIIQADLIINEFQTVTGRLADGLATVTKFNLLLPEDINEDVEHLQSQLSRLKYRESKKVQELSVAIRKEVAAATSTQQQQQQGSSAGGGGEPPQQPRLEALLRQVLLLAKLLDPDSDQLSEEQSSALKGELQDVRQQAAVSGSKGAAKEAQLWRQVEGALEHIVFPGGRQAREAGRAAAASEDEAPEPPEEFLCPISLELMVDPVIMVETAMTYDRASIEQHFGSGHDSCPLSGRTLVSKRMIPNYNLRSAVESWARANGVALPVLQRSSSTASELAAACTPIRRNSSRDIAGGTTAGSADGPSGSRLSGATSAASVATAGTAGSDEDVSPPLPSSITGLVEELETADEDRAEHVLQRICQLTDSNNAARVEMRNTGGIPLLVQWLTRGSQRSRGMVARALWYSARDDDNTMIIANAGAIPLLVQLLWGGTDEGKESAARAFWNLSTYNQTNKVDIARAGAIPALVHLLSFGRPAGKEAAAGALRSLAVNDHNEMEIVRAGAIPALVELLSSGTDNGREVALGALHNLARTDWRSEVASAGVVEVLQDLAAARGVRKEVQRQASNLLKRISSDSMDAA